MLRKFARFHNICGQKREMFTEQHIGAWARIVLGLQRADVLVRPRPWQRVYTSRPKPRWAMKATSHTQETYLYSLKTVCFESERITPV